MQIQKKKWQATQLTTDIKCTNSTASVTLGNVDVFGRSGVVVGHYLHRLVPQFDLGGEVALQYGPQVPGGHVVVPSLAGRVNGE